MDEYISKQDVLKGQKTGTFANGVAFEAIRVVPVGYIESLEPADVAPTESQEIGYGQCANAMLKMWMDNVVTDGEYNRIMDRLNKLYFSGG